MPCAHVPRTILRRRGGVAARRLLRHLADHHVRREYRHRSARRGVRSRYVTAAGGVLLIVLIAFIAPLGRLANAIPAPVVGGTAIIVFSDHRRRWASTCCARSSCGTTATCSLWPHRARLGPAADRGARPLQQVPADAAAPARQRPRHGHAHGGALQHRLPSPGATLGADSRPGAAEHRRRGAPPPCTVEAVVMRTAHGACTHRRRSRPTSCCWCPTRSMLRDGPRRGHAVVVAAGRFREVGPAEALIARNPHLDPARACPATLLMPGFIDAHHHLTPGVRQVARLRRAVGDLPPHLGAAGTEPRCRTRVYLAAKLAALNRCAAASRPWSMPAPAPRRDIGCDRRCAPREAGLRCVLGLICNDLGGRGRLAIAHHSRVRPRRISRAGTADGADPSRRSRSPSPRPRATPCSHGISARCAEAGVLFQTHVNEHLVAVERSLVQRGLRPLEHLASPRRAGTASAARPCHARHAGRAGHAARHRHRRRLQSGRDAVEGQCRSARGDDGRTRHPLRHRHRRHPQRTPSAWSMRPKRRSGSPSASASGDFSCGGGWTLARSRHPCWGGGGRTRRHHRRDRAGQGGRLPAPRSRPCRR